MSRSRVISSLHVSLEGLCSVQLWLLFNLKNAFFIIYRCRRLVLLFTSVHSCCIGRHFQLQPKLCLSPSCGQSSLSSIFVTSLLHHSPVFKHVSTMSSSPT